MELHLVLREINTTIDDKGNYSKLYTTQNGYCRVTQNKCIIGYTFSHIIPLDMAASATTAAL
jgi:hypothetical protein